MPGARVTSGMWSRRPASRRPSLSGIRGAMAAISAAKLLSTNSTLSAGMVNDVEMSSGCRRGLMVWQIACIPGAA